VFSIDYLIVLQFNIYKFVNVLFYFKQGLLALVHF
jgi:hypothetical protein